MKIYVIQSMRPDGDTAIMRDAYTTEEKAMCAVKKYQDAVKAAGGKKVYYYVTLDVIE